MQTIAESQLPPSDRTEQPEVQVEVVKEFDLDLQMLLRERISEDFPQAALGRAMGVSSAAVSDYLAGKPRGNVAAFEQRARNFLARDAEAVDMLHIPEPNRISNEVGRTLRRCQAMGDFGLITSPAGEGKSCAIEIFQRENPLTVVTTAGQMHGDDSAMLNDAWKLGGFRVGKNKERLRRFDLFVKKAKGMALLFVVDDAHFLTRSGLKFWWTVYAKTGCPVVLAGNPSIIANIARLPDEDQFFSRIGLHTQIELQSSDAKWLAEVILDRFAPRVKAELLDLAAAVCRGRGHARRCKKQVRLMLDILEQGMDTKKIVELKRQGFTDAQIAFKAAATQLLAVEDDEK
jgi:hypothetical protein